MALDRAELLFRSFPKSDADDPEVFAVAVTAILSRYPEEVIMEVTDPWTGLASEQNFRPTVHEVKKACDIRYQRVIRREERGENEHQQLEARRIDEQTRKARGGRGAVADYLEQRKPAVVPASAAFILQRYMHFRAMYGDKVTLEPDARAIIEAAGLTIPDRVEPNESRKRKEWTRPLSQLEERAKLSGEDWRK